LRPDRTGDHDPAGASFRRVTNNEDFERTPGGAVLMDGKRLRDEIVTELRAKLDDLGNPLVCLATVLVGDDKPSQIYVRNKRKKAEEAGMVWSGCSTCYHRRRMSTGSPSDRWVAWFGAATVMSRAPRSV